MNPQSQKQPGIPLLLPLGLLGLAFLLWSPVIPAFFASDDFEMVGLVRRGKPLLYFFTHNWLGGSDHGFFRPLVMASLYMDNAFWGLLPAGYHCTNILIHAVNVFLVYIFTQKFVQLFKSDTRIPVIAALLFLVYPRHAEPVTWIMGRTDLLATLFVLAASTAYLKFILTGKTRLVVMAGLLFLFGLMAKESALALPLIIGLLELTRPRLENESQTVIFRIKDTCLRLLPFLLITVFYLTYRTVFLSTPLSGYTADYSFGTQVVFLVKQAIKFPVALMFPPLDFLRPLKQAIVDHLFIAALLFSIILGTLLFIALKKFLTRPSLFCLLACGAALVPVYNLGFSIDTSEGERFFYLASLFFCILTAIFLTSLFTGRKLLIVTFCLAFIWGLCLTRTNLIWKEAGKVTETIVKEAGGEALAYGPENITILNLPDNMRGAFMLRYGLKEALEMMYGLKKPVTVWSYHSIGSELDHATHVLRQGELELRLHGDWNRFLPYFGNEPKVMPVFENDQILQTSQPAGKVFYYSEGHLRQIE